MSDTIFGICQVCSADSVDYPAAGLTGADSTSNIAASGSGTVLEYYDGRLMCRSCAKRLQADDESRISSRRHAEAEKFRGQVGFVKVIP